MPGPPPKANPRRRNARPDTVQLPAEGYQGPIPSWPLSRATKAEAAAWEYYWRLPQAAAWAQQRLERTVARYVRASLVAEKPGAIPSSLAEVRQLEHNLGLTPMAMLRLRWEVVGDELAERREESTATTGTTDVRRLFSAG